MSTRGSTGRSILVERIYSVLVEGEVLIPTFFLRHRERHFAGARVCETGVVGSILVQWCFLFVQALARNLPRSTVIERTSVAGPGFLNVVLSTAWIEQVWRHSSL